MGITPLSAAWMWDLRDAGAFRELTSVIDFGGPQQLNCEPADWIRFAESFITDVSTRECFKERFREIGNVSRLDVRATKALYGAFGLNDYAAIDFADPNADFRANFNEPFEPPRQFDVVTNFGTIEHIFNIGEGFRTIHKLLKPGGIALHALPTYGAYYHGFYNIHSVVFRSLVAGNGYELVNLSYAHDIGQQNERFLSNFRSRLDDITNNEVRLQNVKFFWYYFSSVLKNSERPISLILAAVRKIKDASFVFPQQINKYPMP